MDATVCIGETPLKYVLATWDTGSGTKSGRPFLIYGFYSEAQKKEADPSRYASDRGVWN